MVRRSVQFVLYGSLFVIATFVITVLTGISPSFFASQADKSPALSLAAKESLALEKISPKQIPVDVKSALSPEELLGRLSKFEERLLDKEQEPEEDTKEANKEANAALETGESPELNAELNAELDNSESLTPPQEREEQNETVSLGRSLFNTEKRETTSSTLKTEATVVGQDERLQNLLEEKKTLEIQQDRLIDQIVRYRRELQQLKEQRDMKLVPLGKVGESDNLNDQPLRKQVERSEQEARRLEEKLLVAQTRLLELESISKEKQEMAAQLTATSRQLDKAKEELEQQKSLMATNGYLRGEVEKLTQTTKHAEELANNNTVLKEKLADLKKQAEQFLQDNEALKKKLSEQQHEVATLLEEKASLLNKNTTMKKLVNEKSTEALEVKALLGKAQQESSMCQSSLSEAESKVTKVSNIKRDLLRAQNAILLKETEIRELTKEKGPEVAISNTLPDSDEGNSQARLTTPPPAESDVLLAIVTSKRAHLRGGPGTQHSPVMDVHKGSRLLIETQEGDWYRVITPQGGRAYIESSVVELSGKGPSGPQVGRSDDDSVLVPFGPVPEGFEGGSSSRSSLADAMESSEEARGRQDDEVLKAFKKLREELKKK